MSFCGFGLSLVVYLDGDTADGEMTGQSIDVNDGVVTSSVIGWRLTWEISSTPTNRLDPNRSGPD